MVINDLGRDLDVYNVAESFQCTVEDISLYIQRGPVRQFNVLCQNIRSVDRNLSQIQILLSRLPFELDVVILTECWLNKIDYVPLLNGFTSYSTKLNRSQNEGVIAFVRNGLSAVVSEPPVFEANCLVLKFGTDTAIVAIYRPPSYRSIDNFLTAINDILISTKTFKNVVVTGDLNINIADMNSTDQNCDEYLNLLAQHELLPAHQFPTRLNSCLDHTMLKTILKATSIVLSTSITDHYTLILSLENTRIPKNLNNSYKITNYDNLISDIDMQALNLIFDTNDVNAATLILINELRRVISKNTCLKKVSCRQTIKEPWLTPGLLRCIRNRDRLHANARNDPHNKILATTYKRYRNFCGTLLNSVKNEFDKTEITKAGRDSKKAWNSVKRIAKLYPKNSVPSNDSDLLKIKSNPIDSINFINEHFSKVGQNLASEIILGRDISSHSSLNNTPNNLVHSFALFPTDPVEVQSTIVNLKNTCAVGYDEISSQVLKLANHIISPHISHICNLCFATGCFPSPFKTAVIKPIYKGGDRDSVNNYRPISILPTLSKIFERILNKRLTSYLTKFKLLAENQFGFITGRSTEQAVHELSDYIARQVDKKNKCIGIFLDLAKAFDTVSIPILLNKMEQMGIRHVPLRLFRDYLTNRTQRVKIGNILSDEATISYGVPQGSILGPTLFLIYINELCQLEVVSGKAIVFADDTVLLFSAPTWKQVSLLAEIGLKEIMSWLRDNLLTLNLNKTKFVTFSKTISTQPQTDSIHIRAHTCNYPSSSPCSCLALQRASFVRYLGVMVDQLLNWQEHIKSLTGRVRKLIRVFKRLRHLPLHLLKTTYYALCQSLLAYCISVWGGTCKTHMIRVERSQRGVLKTMLSKPFRFPTKTLFAEIKILTVRQLFILKTVIKTHSIVPFDKKRLTELRRKDAKITQDSFLSAFAHRQYCFLGLFVYKKINKILNIHPLSLYKCKSELNKYLITLNYDETENILLPLK